MSLQKLPVRFTQQACLPAPDKCESEACTLRRSICSLPGQWAAHGSMAPVSMPCFSSAEKGATPSPPLSPRAQPQQGIASIAAAENATGQQDHPQSSEGLPSSQQQRKQPEGHSWQTGEDGGHSAGQSEPSAEPAAMSKGKKQEMQHAGSKLPRQGRLDLSPAQLISAGTAYAEQCPTKESGCSLHAAMLVQLDLQDKEVWS